MKRTGLVLTMLLFACGTQLLTAQNLRMVADPNPTNSLNEEMVTSRTVLNNKIYFVANDGSDKRLFTMDGNGASILLPQVKASRLHNTGSLLIFWGDDGSTGTEPWRSDGTVNGSFMLANLNKTPVKKNTGSGSQLKGGITTIGSTTYFGCFVSYKILGGGPVWDQGLYKTDGSSSGTTEIYHDMYSIRMTGLNGDLIVDGIDNATVGRELWSSDGSTTVPIGILSPGATVGDDDNPYEQWYNGHLYVRPEPVVAAGCAFFNTRSLDQGNELWCTDGNALRQLTGLTNGAYSTYPVQMTVMDGVLYFVGLDATHGSELWSFPLTDPMNTGTAAMVQDLYPGANRSEPCWLTVYDGDLYFSAITEATGRELFRYDGTSIQLVADIAPGTASSNPKYAPDDMAHIYPEMWDDTPDRFSFLEFNGKLYFAADDGVHGYELWSYDAATAAANLVVDVNSGSGGSDPGDLVLFNGKLYFTAYTPAYGRAWYEYDPGGSTSNQPPVAVVSANPQSGNAPLAVTFNGSASFDPDGSITGYDWNFGDGAGTSTLADPTYAYGTAGTYIAQLTVTDNDNATDTEDITITVTASSTGAVYVAAQTVTRVTVPGNKIAGQDIVLIKDDTGAPVSGAVVTATYSGPTAGIVSATTGSTGEATLLSEKVRNPSVPWCFTVTDVAASGKTYTPSLNVVTTQCESTPKSGSSPAVTQIQLSNHPNPFRSSTRISFSIPHDGNATMIVTDILGREVARLSDGAVSAGTHSITFNASQLPAGLYHCRIETAGETQIHNMLLMK